MKAEPNIFGEALQRAYGLHQQGKLDQAETLYRQILERNATNFAALQLLGVLRSQQGNQAEAITLIEAALKIQPSDIGAQFNYGLALASAGRNENAITAYDNVLSIKSSFFQAHYNRAIALASLRRFEDALIGFEKALTFQPDNAECYYNIALVFVALKKSDKALANYDKALARNPRLSEALDNRGNVLRDLSRLDEALCSYDKAIAISPRNFRTLYNRGVVLSDLKRPEEAIASYDAALAINPDIQEAWLNRGISQMALNLFAEALASFDRSLALHPDDIQTLDNKATALRQLGRRQEALANCNQALLLNPNHVPALMTRALLLQEATRFAEAITDYDRILRTDTEHAQAWNGRGATLYAMGRADEALASFERSIRIKPDIAESLTNRAHLRWALKGDYAGAIKDLTCSMALDPHQPYVPGQLVHIKMQVADWSDLDRKIDQINAGVRAGRRVVRPFVYQAISQSPADLQSCSRIFATDLFPAEPNRYFYEPANPHQKIKIGYVSGEFREQATAYLMAGLYERHDRNRFEVIAIDNVGACTSPMRKRLEAAFDGIMDISKLSDDDAADRVRNAEIDILVNLNGYFGSPRMGLFARRPARLQVNYLGFPATLGAGYIDYIIADHSVIPADEQCFYDEQVVLLPHSYQANDCKRPIAADIPSRASLELPDEAFVFCNFNQSYKLTPQIFASWVRILKETKGSVLWLLESKSPFSENLKRAAERHGVSHERLIFAPPIPSNQHLARLKRADLFLDTLPYNAHTTASDALWTGLPLLTCRGTAFPGRVAASLLHAVGMPELITDNLEQYEALALKLACVPAFYQSIKQKLQRNRLNTPLFNTDQFRREIEAAYTMMWEIAQSGARPRGFCIASTD